jgi:cysteine desulfuration protein SufE
MENGDFRSSASFGTGPLGQGFHRTMDIAKKIGRFRSLNREMRLQALLGYARKFPEIPEELTEARDAGLGRVEECQTPLFLWVSVTEEGLIQIHADAPREAPTVRGFVSFLMELLNGQPADTIAKLPQDVLSEMGLAEVLGVMRTNGLSAVLYRVRHDVERAVNGKQPGS